MGAATARVALVTGANRGMGLETCRQWCAHGLHVVLTGRDERATRRALEGLGHTAGTAIAVRMDVTDPTSIEAAQRTVVERFDGVDAHSAERRHDAHADVGPGRVESPVHAAVRYDQPLTSPPTL